MYIILVGYVQAQAVSVSCGICGGQNASICFGISLPIIIPFMSTPN
jgi:hypothetical protein